MGAAKPNHGKKGSKENETMVGTFFSVGVVGAVILFTYIVLYGLFMARF